MMDPREEEDRSAPPEAPPAAEDAPAPPQTPEEAQAARVLDAGTSQELVIVNYADESFLSPRHRDLVADKSEKSGPSEETAAPREPDALELGSLVIVRDAAALEMEPPPRPPAAAPPSVTTPAAPSETSPGPSSERDGARPHWARRETSAAFPPPPPLPKPPPPPLPPRAAAAPEAAFAPAPAARPSSADRDIEDLFVQPDFSKTRTPREPRPESTTKLAAPPKRPPTAKLPRPAKIPAPAPAPPMLTVEPRVRSRAARPEAPLASSIVTMLAFILFAGAATLSVMHVEPFYTWFYLFAWVPFLLTVNHLTARHSRAHSIFTGRIRQVGALAAWSIPVWLFFELLNFRLEDWYYVGVPDEWFARRVGVALAFATVLPGIFFLEELQGVRGTFDRLRTRPFEVTPTLERICLRAGLACTALVLALPTFFFALVWGVPVLLLEPWLHRRGATSLLGEMAAGRPGRIFRLLIAGMGCGIFWEAANFVAGGKWIYTVPGFAHFKLFEMPLLGFVGFAPFALACWSMARALVYIGLLPDWTAPERPAPAVAPASGEDAPPAPAGMHILSKGARLSLIAWTALVSLLVLEGMDRWTVDSRTPRPEDVPAIPDGVAQYAHGHGYHDVKGLLTLIDGGRLHVPGASSEEELARLQNHCRLVLLRGIGTANARRLDAVGVHSIADLAGRDASALSKALQGVEPGWRPRTRRVAVWVDAAQHAAPRAPQR